MVALPMPVSDSMFLTAETRETPMHVGSMQLFSPPEGRTGPEALRETYERLIVQDDLGPIFRKKPFRGPLTAGQWAWEEDDDVELRHHVRRSALPTPGRPLELMELVGRLHGTLLDRARPLWETHLVEGMADGRFAVYTKLHHSVADGISALRLSQSALSRDPAEVDAPAPWTYRAPRRDAPEGHGALGQLVGAGRGIASTGWDLVGMGPALARTVWKGLRDEASMLPFQAPKSILNGSVSASRRFAAQDWSVQRIREAGKNVGGATVNDVVLAMCSGALRSYLADLGQLPAEPLVAMVPMSLRTGGDDSTSGNAVGTLLCNLGTHLADPLDRLAEIQDSMTKSKAGLAGLSPLQITLLSAGVMVPPFLGSFVKAQDVTRPAYNLVISNVPGSRDQLYFDGARLDAIYPLSIPQQGQAMNITCVSSGDRLGFGIVGCRKTLPSLQRLLGYLEDELALLER